MQKSTTIVFERNHPGIHSARLVLLAQNSTNNNKILLEHGFRRPSPKRNQYSNANNSSLHIQSCRDRPDTVIATSVVILTKTTTHSLRTC
mmetsp:Transcript_17619/g.43976  ORF Transcript_17619/g.43976 Transcript_17619/m.43976 type:complete len:90 (+) Transcript_17619:344-613(+)